MATEAVGIHRRRRSRMRKHFLLLVCTALTGSIASSGARGEDTRLWGVYDSALKKAKYIDLTHAFSPSIPVWPGFGHAQSPAVAGAAIPGEVEKGREFTYAKDGFVASAYDLPTDQYGTQLDPVHGEARGIPHVEIEIRQDLIGSDAGQQQWARLLAECLGRGLDRLDAKVVV
jgi:hypothetical protein